MLSRSQNKRSRGRSTKCQGKDVETKERIIIARLHQQVQRRQQESHQHHGPLELREIVQGLEPAWP